MSVSFCPGVGNQCWNRECIRERLQNVVDARRKGYWIRSDLSLHRPSCIQRIFWAVFVGHFVDFRRSYYSVDYAVSRRVLLDLGDYLLCTHPNDDVLMELFFKAVNNYELIAPCRWHVVLTPQLLAVRSRFPNLSPIVPVARLHHPWTWWRVGTHGRVVAGGGHMVGVPAMAPPLHRSVLVHADRVGGRVLSPGIPVNPIRGASGQPVGRRSGNTSVRSRGVVTQNGGSSVRGQAPMSHVPAGSRRR